MANKPQVSDRRDGIRCSCSLTATCEPIPAADHFPGTVLNISENGIGLLLDRQVVAGTQLWVVMRGANDDLLGKMMIRIVRVTSQPDGHWMHGCLFAKELSDEGDQSAPSRNISDSGINW
jgi:hypothetical protein